MAKIHEYNATEKMAIIEELQAGEGTRVEIAVKYNIHVSTLVKWRLRFELYGIENRKFQADAPNEKWLKGVTEFKYGHGQKAYLSAILDLLATPLFQRAGTFEQARI